LKKGRQVYIEGSLRTDKYTDKDGVERFSTDIIAAEMQMLGGNAGEGGGTGGGGGNFQRSQGGGGGQRQGGGNYGGNQRSGGGDYGNQRGGGNDAPRSAPAPADNSFDDDDIPF
jgi:single-strand DNA-binding protein